jgi:predicted AAA+ superfamily ATPase
VRRAHLVVGPRQAGKSTLVWSIVGSAPGDLRYVNCE